ncbi:MAG: YIEGIA family protein [Novibacillus thermophilus]|jgi:hypothetical protein|uniref:YIEGIA protein n=1 Tax=Novibacillus thermophilus TaxID=1471761 RepID=A0A1U9K9E7_9BACL|nr:YIEGIA family protein [Novibacillus thermophilus]AQS56654.1 hypothetical protein B0W44_13715 [Novibacillus thermophilus]
MDSHIWAVSFGLFFGLSSRLMMLITDYRQYPTHPHGKVIHIALGAIAAGLGAVAVPALLEPDFSAITFLGVAAQQFRDVRNMERETLSKLDQFEMVPRGTTYIEGIALSFEGRNYLVIFVAFMTSLATIIVSEPVGVVTGILFVLVSWRLRTGQYIRDIAVVREGRLHFDDDHLLYVDDIVIMNVGLKNSREAILKYGIGLMIEPKSRESVITLSNVGQRQAILHDVSSVLGIFSDTGIPSLTPLAKRDLETGRIGVFLIPQIRDLDLARQVAERVPVLENAVRLPKEF